MPRFVPFLLAALLALAALPLSSLADVAARPNILLIVADDQRWDTIRALGNPEIKTPNLDALVERGLVFRNAYCMGSMIPAVCAPSRTMLMTGRSLWHIPAPNAKTYDKPTLGGTFRQGGYETLFTGKRGNTFLAGNQAFETVVFDEPRDNGKADRADSSRFHVDTTLAWLKDRPAGKPFFAYIAPPVPHDPRLAPSRFMALYDPAKLSLSPNFLPQHPFDNGELKVRDELLAAHPRTEAEMKRHLADYYATITNFDFELGRLFSGLREAGQLEKTLIVYTSDQGLAVGGRHGLMGKQNLYEHVKPPLVLAGPGIPKGESRALVYLYDLYPTLAAYAGLTAPADLDGKNLLPVVRGEQPRVRETLLGAYRDCQRMIRDEEWKLLSYRAGGERHVQLFHVSEDPDELRDLSKDGSAAGQRQRLEALLEQSRREAGDPIDFAK